MSALDGMGGHLLDQRRLPPKEQRIIAPSTVDIIDGGGYSQACDSTLAVVDLINLTVYFVPLTPRMATDIRAALAKYDTQSDHYVRPEDRNR